MQSDNHGCELEIVLFAGNFFHRINYSTEADPHGCELKIVFRTNFFYSINYSTQSDLSSWFRIENWLFLPHGVNCSMLTEPDGLRIQNWLFHPNFFHSTNYSTQSDPYGCELKIGLSV